MLKRQTLGIIASVLVIVGLSAGYYSNILPINSLITQSVAQPCNRPEGYLLVVMDGLGFNSSRVRGTPWPLLHVHRGDTVDIIVCNLDSSQAHGFAIDHYFDKGVALGPGQVYKIHFVANDTGDFVIYCDVFCPVHSYMIGRLTVRG